VIIGPGAGQAETEADFFWVETSQLQARGRHHFYSRLSEIIERAKFDIYAERICRKYYATKMDVLQLRRASTSVAF
jgi:hypothetical protein